jgi:hypothetical protein
MKTQLHAFFVVLLVGAVPAPAATTDIDFGLVVLSISESETAQLFHIVDQLSEWDQYTHKQYGRWARSLGFTDEDRAQLQRHAALRRVRGRGNGFEQAFLVDDTIDGARSRAIRDRLLTAAEAAEEAEILRHFAPKLTGLIAQQRARLLQFRSRLAAQRETLAPTIARLARFSELRDTVRVPVFFIANPDEGSGGGGANGGRLVVEVPAADQMAFLLHEALHFLLTQHADLIRRTAESAGLTWQLLNEGLAYAIAPGLLRERPEQDPLVEQLVRYSIRGTPASDPYVQSYSMAAVIRPALQAALDRGETITTFLPTAIERWRAVAPRSP